MPETKQKPEPWEMRYDDNYQANIWCGDTWVALFPHQCVKSLERVAAEYAQRACACVNACAGINPEAVKDLLEACEQARKLLLAEHMGRVDLREPRWIGSAIRLGPMLDAAIAKAKG